MTLVPTRWLRRPDMNPERTSQRGSYEAALGPAIQKWKKMCLQEKQELINYGTKCNPSRGKLKKLILRYSLMQLCVDSSK
jgi:hypothetical protein